MIMREQNLVVLVTGQEWATGLPGVACGECRQIIHREAVLVSGGAWAGRS